MREASVSLIRSHYAGLTEKWDRMKVLEFCKLLQVSEDEMSAYLNMRSFEFRTCIDKNKFPGPACVLLDLWENYYYYKVLHQDLKDYPSPV